MENRLKFIGLFKMSSLKLIHLGCNEKSLLDTFQKEALKVITQIKEIKMTAEERQKINTSNGSWFAKIDDQDVGYLLLATVQYPERHAYSCISELQEELQKQGDYSSLDEIKLKALIKSKMKEMIKKYNDLAGLDKIIQAQSQVEETTIVLQDNVKKLLLNQQNLDKLNAHSESMNIQAKAFQKQSGNLKSIMFWRNMRLNIMIGLVVLGALLFILVPIIIKYSGNKHDNDHSSSTTDSSSSTSPSPPNNKTLLFFI